MKRTLWMEIRERLSGRLHIATMRAIHRFGWCYPQPTQIEPGHVWCHWCGMRGRKPAATGGVIPKDSGGYLIREGDCR